MEKIKIAIYCRISPFADEFTLTHLCGVQKAVLMEKAAASNFEVTDCYEDIGYTGDDAQRPALQRLLRDYADGKFSLVFVVNRERLFKGDFLDAPKLSFPILASNRAPELDMNGKVNPWHG